MNLEEEYDKIDKLEERKTREFERIRMRENIGLVSGV